jgi:hypothetical protein
MKLTINLDTKSVQNAIKELYRARNNVPKAIDELLALSCERLAFLANENLETTTIGETLKSKIKSSWKIAVSNGIATLTNLEEKAVYVEFGTGVVGENNPHPKANSSINNPRYKYNVPSESKYAGKYHDEDTWRFYTQDEEAIDLQEGFYEVWALQDGVTLKVITKGSPATMFLFNAIMRFKGEKHAQQLWEQVKEKYWG